MPIPLMFTRVICHSVRQYLVRPSDKNVKSIHTNVGPVAGRSGDRIPVGARFSAPVQTGPGAQPASCTMGTGSFPVVKSARGVTLTSHPLLVPWLRKNRAIPLLLLWPYGLYRTSVPVQGCNLPFLRQY